MPPAIPSTVGELHTRGPFGQFLQLPGREDGGIVWPYIACDVDVLEDITVEFGSTWIVTCCFSIAVLKA